MLEGLFGNKNVQRILLFLFVNGTCYGTELHRFLKAPLTPIQKALNRLEKSGIIISEYLGKTRVYRFNPSYPLLNELEQLLKKAYTLLPPLEKKIYYVVKESFSSVEEKSQNQMPRLLAFWEKLGSVTLLSFTAKSKEPEVELGWNGRGRGNVAIVREGSNRLIFNEKGSWMNKQGQEFDFSNIFRWTLDRSREVVSLEHLRMGPDRPVFLFHLAPSGKHALASVDSHLCDGDAYFGQIHFNRRSFRLSWRVIGPKKNEEIVYYYS